ncbi:hypothetical protein V1511DRAFT_212692 [Dipodascopsis uninucleata]
MSSPSEPSSASRSDGPRSTPTTKGEILKQTEQLAKQRRRKVFFELAQDKRPIWIQKLSPYIDQTLGRYKHFTKKQPFLAFGLPFMVGIYVASLYLTEFTQMRYKNYDDTHISVSDVDLEKKKKLERRKESKEDYYERNYKFLQSVASEDYDIKRVERRPGDPPTAW